MKTIIISDCHIGDPHAKVTQLLDLLLTCEANRIIIAGDLWELWGRSFKSLRKEHERVINVFNVLANTGVRLEYILGNHDEKYLKDPLVPLNVMPVVKRADIKLRSGKTLTVIHGHYFDKYLQKFHWLYWLGFRIKLFRKFACPSWWRRNKSVGESPPFDKLMDEIHRRAEKTQRKKGYDGIIMGHTHVPDMHTHRDNFLYINSGDWLEHTSYVEIIDGGTPKLCNYQSQKN